MVFSLFFRKAKPENSQPADVRRRHPRLQIPEGKWPIVIRSFSGVRISPQLLNISSGGLCFQADRKDGELTYEDDRLTVEFLLPKERLSITVQARLAWLYKHPRNPSYQAGIKFGRQPAEIQRQIEVYIKKVLEAGGAYATIDTQTTS